MSATIYTNLRYWDGVADSLSTETAIAVENNRVVAQDSVPDAVIKDMTGLIAIPGLIDAHVHLCLNPEVRDPEAHGKLPEEQIFSEIKARAYEMVLAGITTARDLGGGAYIELRVRDAINRGDIPGPRLLCAGQPITSVKGHCHFWGGEATDTLEAIQVLERQHSNNVDLVKVMATGGNLTPGSRPADTQFEDETMAEIVKLATKYGYHVAAHCHGTDGIRQAATAGVTTVEHCSWVGESGWGKSFDLDVVSALAKNNTWVSPTINAGWKRFGDKGDFVEMVQSNYARMKAAGVKLIASTDAGIPNVYHHDLPKALPVFALFAGLSPVEVLRSATSDCAEAIGLGGETGKIRDGYSADFVFYEANPLKDLQVLEKPAMIVMRGREFRP